MRWLILKTTAALFAALLGIVLIVYQQNYLKSSFRAAEKTGDSFRALHADYITLQRIVLQAFAGDRNQQIFAGADGVAVISAVCAADDPEAATRELRAVVDAALAERAKEGAR